MMSHQFYFHEGQQLLAEKKFHEAIILFQHSIHQCPTQGDYHASLSQALLQIGKLEQAIFHLNQSQHFGTQLPIAPLFEEATKRLTQRKNKPGICFNSLHRSGTLYIHRSLARGLDMAEVNISASVPLQYNVLILQLVERLSHGGAISQDHFLPNPLNLWTIKQYFDRLIVHIRDPRQAMLSAFIQLEEYRKKKAEVIQYDDFNACWNPKSPNNTQEERLDELITTEFQAWVQYVQSWVQASKHGSLEILITQHRHLKEEPQSFFENILSFYNIPVEQFKFPQKPQSAKHSIMSKAPDLNSPNIHYRQGEIDEWITVFSPEQKKKMRALMPDELFQRFGWVEGC